MKMTSGGCKECGCHCSTCGHSDLDLHQQIAELHSQLQKSNNYIANAEETFQESKQSADLELTKSKEELFRLRERYDRLLDSHKKMQKINHDLEDKLLNMVNKFEAQKVSLQLELSDMMNRLVEARTLITQLDEESEKYRMDCNMAVQLLQCKPSNFVSHRLNTLPLDLQERVKQMMSKEQLVAAENSVSEQEQQRTVRIPMATFPPTAMVYSLQESTMKKENPPSAADDTHHLAGYVPSSLIARALSQASPRRKIPRSFLCQACKRDVHHVDSGCQVDLLKRGSRPVEITAAVPAHPNMDRGVGRGRIHSPPKPTGFWGAVESHSSSPCTYQPLRPVMGGSGKPSPHSHFVEPAGAMGGKFPTPGTEL